MAATSLLGTTQCIPCGVVLAGPPSHPYSPAGLALGPGSACIGSTVEAAAVDADAADVEAEAAGGVDEGEGSGEAICDSVESASVALGATSFAHPVNIASARPARPWLMRRAVLTVMAREFAVE